MLSGFPGDGRDSVRRATTGSSNGDDQQSRSDHEDCHNNRDGPCATATVAAT